MLEGFQLFEQMRASRHHLLARNALGKEARSLLRILLDIADQLDQQAFQRIVVASAGCFRAFDPGDERLRRTQ